MSIIRIYNLRSGRKMIHNTPKLIFFDLETTGFNPFHCNIIEIAAKDNRGNTFHSLVDLYPLIIFKITSLLVT